MILNLLAVGMGELLQSQLSPWQHLHIGSYTFGQIDGGTRAAPCSIVLVDLFRNNCLLAMFCLSL